MQKQEFEERIERTVTDEQFPTGSRRCLYADIRRRTA